MPVSLMVALRQPVEPLSSSLTSFVVPKNDLSTPHEKGLNRASKSVNSALILYPL